MAMESVVVVVSFLQFFFFLRRTMKYWPIIQKGFWFAYMYIETISYYKMNAALSTKGESVLLLDCLSTINGRNTYFDMSANTIKVLLAIEVNFFQQNLIKTDLNRLT